MEQLENCHMVCKIRYGEFNENGRIFQLWLKELVVNGHFT